MTAPAMVQGTRTDRAAQTVRELVDLGPRMGGTPSGDRSVAYLLARFKAMGLPSRTILEKEHLVHWETSWNLSATLSAFEDLPVETFHLQRAWPYGFSPAAVGEAEIGLGAADGMVGLFSNFHTPRRKGPALTLALVDGFNTTEGDWPKLRPLRSSARNRYPVFGISNASGKRLRQGLAQGRSVRLKYKLEATIEKRKSQSVEAIIEAPSDAAPGFFLVCAHGDSDAGGPGANDNASGVAIVLEMAHSWKTAIDQGLCEPPARQVRFVIWGTEIKSTREYLNRYLADPESAKAHPILGVLNFDQAGFGAGAEQLNVEPDDLASNTAFVRMASAILNEHKDTEGYPKRWATNKSLGGTDSYVFSSSKLFRQGGLPSVTLFTSAWDKPEEHARTQGMPGESWRDRNKVSVDFDPYYHSAGDLPEFTTDREPHNMVWCARVGLSCVARFLDGL
ncbi:MAG: M28 family peptidase [Planctomycetes bacterium]|nr:M28 family peptidase [Planctomycetota bacterium]